jgi:hypothetical protein
VRVAHSEVVELALSQQQIILPIRVAYFAASDSGLASEAVCKRPNCEVREDSTDDRGLHLIGGIKRGETDGDRSRTCRAPADSPLAEVNVRPSEARTDEASQVLRKSSLAYSLPNISG